MTATATPPSAPPFEALYTSLVELGFRVETLEERGCRVVLLKRLDGSEFCRFVLYRRVITGSGGGGDLVCDAHFDPFALRLTGYVGVRPEAAAPRKESQR